MEQACPAFPSAEEIAQEVQRHHLPEFPFFWKWEGGWYELALRTALYESLLNRLIIPAVKGFAGWEERYPNSLLELCAYPHLPFQCEQVISPLDGKPLVELKPPQIGSVEFVTDQIGSALNARLEIRAYFPDPYTGEPTIGYTAKLQAAAGNLPPFPFYYTAFELMDLKKESPQPESALTLNRHMIAPEIIKLSIMERIFDEAKNWEADRHCFSGPFSSSARLLEARSFLELLRNPYTNQPVAIYDEFQDVAIWDIPEYRVPPGDALFLTHDPRFQRIVVIERSGKPLGVYLSEKVKKDPKYRRWVPPPPEGWRRPWDK